MNAAALLFGHYARHTLRTRIGVLFGLLQPMLYLLFFGPLVGDWQVVVPGLLIQLTLLSAGLAGFGVVFEQRSGVLDRLRVAPVSRLSLLLGRVLRDTAVLLVQSLVILAVGFALGLRAPLLGVVLGLLLLVPLSAGVAAASCAVALRPGAQDAFAPMMSTVLIPVLLLSGAFLPMSSAPTWLDVLSRCDPFRYAVDALRALYAGDYAGASLGLGVTLAVALVTTVIGVRAFRRTD